MNNGLSEEEIIAIGDLETSSHLYVAEVRDTLNNLEKRLSEASSGLVSGFEDKAVKTVTAPLRISGSPRGFGHVASSFEHNKSMETLWAAIIARAFMESELKFHPIVIPIDEYYRFLPSYLSIVGKTTEISRNKMCDASGRPYAIILSGFTDSVMFKHDVLQEMPVQHEIYGCKVTGRKPMAMIQAFEKFCESTSTRIFEDNNGSAKSALEMLATAGKKDDAALLLCSALLLQDSQRWQNLWYEQKQGIPLYIVAPFHFHQAMTRMNAAWGWGHTPSEYNYRAGCSLGDYWFPPINVVDGRIKGMMEYSEEETRELIYKKNINGAEFEARIKPILDKFPKPL